jgi:hypothetical protein
MLRIAGATANLPRNPFNSGGAVVRSWTLGSLIIALAVAVAACGGPAGGGPAGPGPGGADDLPTSATVDATSEREPHALAPGRYRLQWTAVDCRPSLLITDAQTGDVAYENARPSVRVIFVPQLAGGEYFIEQINDECEEWSITVSRF